MRQLDCGFQIVKRFGRFGEGIRESCGLRRSSLDRQVERGGWSALRASREEEGLASCDRS
ncbi:hypothetical protein MA16_Dca000331 [Dendrobium catenatum]|uniref:Uncharacterized protein n=1 Tax=Dendrobium catenatum TaxID=906689 RepID=A0A2I0WTK6_9ASPA|nr:hypothetical protein MA16_Dca000331 [Dendrobium catenatum]